MAETILSSVTDGRVRARALIDVTRMEIDVETVDLPQHEMSRALVGFWAENKSGECLPSRRLFPSRPILRLMPHIFILEPADGGRTDWLFRLAGTAFPERFGADPTGLKISQLYQPAQVAHNAAQYRERCDTRTSLVTRGRFLGIEKDFFRFEIVHVPIQTTDGAGLLVLGGLFFLDS